MSKYRHFFLFWKGVLKLDDLKISIIGTLDEELTVAEINKKIGIIESKINNVNIQVDDKKLTSTLNNFTKQMEQLTVASRNAGKVIAETMLPDGTKVKTTYFDSMTKGFQQVIDDAKTLQGVTDKNNEKLNSQAKAVKDLTSEYKTLAKEIKNSNPDGSIKSITSTYVNSKGNARVIKTDGNNNVINYKDIEGFKILQQEQDKARKSLQELWRTGKLTKDELKSFAKSVNTADNVKQINQLNSSLKNLKFDNNIKIQQDRLIEGFKRLFDQGKIGQVTFDKFNNAIKSANNIKELDKLQNKLTLVSNSANNKNLQQKLVSDAQTQLRTHNKTIDVNGVNQLIESIQNVRPNNQNASNQLQQLQGQLKGYTNNAKEAARSSLTFGDAMQTAFQKFPVWMIATTA